MHRVLLDANFLILPFQYSVDLFGELDRLLDQYELYTLNRTYNEALNVEDGRYRNMVKRLVEEHGITVITMKHEGTVDDALIAAAAEYIICTNDKAVREALRDRERPHIYLRQRNHLEGAHLPPR